MEKGGKGKGMREEGGESREEGDREKKKKRSRIGGGKRQG